MIKARQYIGAYCYHLEWNVVVTYAVYAYLVGREESIGREYKGITIAQWDNRLQNGIFVNRTQ